MGLRISGWGTSEQPCLAMSRPIRLTYEAVELENQPPDGATLVTYWFGERWVSTWLFPKKLVDAGYLDQTFCDPVLLAVEGSLEGEYLVAAMYAIRYLRDEPVWIDLGSVVRFAANLRYGGDPRGEIADVLLSRLQGDPANAIEELIAKVRLG
jgi:hypothetical protein